MVALRRELCTIQRNLVCGERSTSRRMMVGKSLYVLFKLIIVIICI